MYWMELLAYWVVSGLALALTAAVVPGFRLKGFGAALIASLMIGIVNFFLRGILVFFTFPFYILTLGLFRFVVDAIILRIAAAFLDDFEISGWISAILGAVILAIASSALHLLLV
jgi:putative membrane protein